MNKINIIKIIFKMSFILYILCFYFCLFSLSFQQIINNPIKTNKEFNLIDYIIIFQSDGINIKLSNSTSYYKIKKDFKKLIQNSYMFSRSLILCNDQSNNNFLLLNNNYYKVELIPEINIKTIELIERLEPNFKYSGYIKAFQSNITRISIQLKLCPTLKDEIIIYGQSEQNLYFYFSKENISYKIEVGNIEKQISCKLYMNSRYICAFL